MRVVHAAWVPAEAGDLGGELLFWAEEPAGAPRPAVAGPAHPFALGLGPLRDLLVELGVGGQLVPGAASLLLPSADDRPLPDGDPADRARLRPWRVAGLRAPLTFAAEWLSGRATASGDAADPTAARDVADRQAVGVAAPAAEGDGRGVGPIGAAPRLGGRERTAGTARPEVGTAGQEARLGDDLRFWGLVARFGLELVARELVVPGLDRRADGDFQALWQPVLTPPERRRLRGLVEAMPPACRAAAADDASASEAVPAAELVGGFVGAVVDALTRSWLAEAAWPEARWMTRQGMPSGPARWLEALSANRSAGARLSARRFGDLAPEVAAWSDAALGGRSPPFRAALRLHPPAADRDRWQLDYLLQAADDPTVLVPAARVWRIDGTVARLAGRRVVEPQELLLADLARAARAFAPIAASLAEPRPSGVGLTPEEAYAFLREAAPALAEQGLAVLLPGWWTRGRARRRLGLRLALRPGPTDRPAEGGFGLQALVDYDWRVALGDELLTPAEFERLVQQKLPLVQMGGEWVELRPEDVERIVRFWREHPFAAGGHGALTLAQALRLTAAGDEAPPVEVSDATGWLGQLLEGARRLEELPEPPGFLGELRHYQRRGYAWLRFMRDHRLGACLADDMGLGKCGAADTRVFVNGELRTLEELWLAQAVHEEFDGEGYWASPRETLLVNALDEVSGRIVQAPVRRLYRQRVREKLRRIRLGDGSSVTITRPHRLLSIDRWTNGLAVGDYVGVPAQLIWSGDPADRDLVTFLAWQIAEGYEEPRRWTLTVTQKDASRLEELLGTLRSIGERYGLPLNRLGIVRHSSGRAACLRVTSQAYRRFLESQGYRWGRLSREKEIPPLVMQADRETVRLFLRHYFDAEASVVESMRSIEISSASPTLIEQLNVLLRRFGIWLRVSTKRKRATNGSGVFRDDCVGVLGGNAARRFLDEIGFGDPRKQARLEEICRYRANTNVEGIPASRVVADSVAAAGLPVRHFGLHNSVYLNGTPQFSRASLERAVAGFERLISGEAAAVYREGGPSRWRTRTLGVYAALDVALLDHTRVRLQRLLDREVFYCRIKAIEEVDYDGWVYDLEVEHHHNFVANGVLCHNTIQTIAALLDQKTPPVLIVCPTTVLGNWVRELAKFAPGLRVLVHHGPTRRPDDQAFAQAAGAHDVVLTTYALVHRDEAQLQAVTWATVVLDEAQNVKNPAARTSRAVRRLPAADRIALTGTPVENRLGELWAIMEFLNPGFLGSAEGFRRRFAVPIERGRDAGRAEELRRLVAPFILRRLKTDPNVIQDLPDKLELKTYPPLTREQASLYEAVVQDMLDRIAEKEGVQRRGLVLAALTKLKQVCNHPSHFLGEGSERALAGRSGKLTRLEEMLDEAIAAGDHMLVFTQFAEWGGRLRAYLQERLGSEVLYLHGGTPAAERDRLVERFQRPDGPPVFVLSLRAGGTGLNLTRANRVIHYDRWWNPAVETQATDRAFRIGQTRDVLVHAFICAGTLEERIDELIESKRALAETVIGTGESWLTDLSTEELREIVTLRQAVIADA